MIPSRMINEAVYCDRLFYLMHVEGQFLTNRYTADGIFVHRRVDAKADSLIAQSRLPGMPDPQQDFEARDLDGEHEKDQPDSEMSKRDIHARSVTLGCDELQVVAKLDLIETDGTIATPVDYKRGSPRRGPDGSISAWDPERVQICLQALVLRANGFQCDRGILYFNETRQRVTVEIDQPLIDLTKAAVDRAHKIQEYPKPPPPLVASPKCPNCSLSPVCLPDETNRCRPADESGGKKSAVRLPSTPRDDQRPLYLNTQGLFVGKADEVLQIKNDGRIVQEVRLREINQVNLFGNIQISIQALQTLCQLDVPTILFSSHGNFRGMLQTTGLKNILLRRNQFRIADDSARSLEIAKLLISAKIANSRVLLMRNHVEPPTAAIKELKRIIGRCERAISADTLLGIEGNAARIYFSHFSGMLKPGDQPADPAAALPQPPKWAFDFTTRSRRPPKDPVNAMLSLAYSLLSKDLTVAAATTGLDPYLGFYHQPRPGKPALALDLMEPFRPLIAESVVITAINNRMVTPQHFTPGGDAVHMTESGRKAFFKAYETRMDQLVTHPLFDYRVSYRRLLEIQTRLIGKMISGEIDKTPIFVTR